MKHVMAEIIDKYYTELETIVNDMAQKCTGGEETTVCFPAGKVIIKLK